MVSYHTSASPACQSWMDATPSTTPISYVIMFGYPFGKYSVTVEYFKSLGVATGPEPNTEIVNCISKSPNSLMAPSSFKVLCDRFHVRSASVL